MSENEKKLGGREILKTAIMESSQSQEFVISWSGERVPPRITIFEYDSAEEPVKRTLLDEEIGRMSDGVIFSKAGSILGTYRRTIDNQLQGNSTMLNEIIFRPINQENFLYNLFNQFFD